MFAGVSQNVDIDECLFDTHILGYIVGGRFLVCSVPSFSSFSSVTIGELETSLLTVLELPWGYRGGLLAAALFILVICL